MSARPEERRTAALYDARLAGGSLIGVLMRGLTGRAGVHLVNTPLVDVPEVVGLDAGHRVLDLGCGSGALLRALESRVGLRRPAVGIDASLAMLRHATRLNRDGGSPDLAAAVASRLPFRDESFDVVLSSYLFKHLNDDTLFRVLLELYRIVKPGGIVLGWEFAPLSSRRLNRFHARLLTPVAGDVRLRGFGFFAPYALEAGFAQVERVRFRTPFLFPPIPRVVVKFQKGRGPTAE